MKFQLEFLMQNTRCYVFSHPLNANSNDGNFTNYSGYSIRKEIYILRIQFVLIYPMPFLGGNQWILWHFQATINCPSKFSSAFLFLFTKKLGHTFEETHVSQLFLYVLFLTGAKNYKLCTDCDAHLLCAHSVPVLLAMSVNCPWHRADNSFPSAEVNIEWHCSANCPCPVMALCISKYRSNVYLVLYGLLFGVLGMLVISS